MSPSPGSKVASRAIKASLDAILCLACTRAWQVKIGKANCQLSGFPSAARKLLTDLPRASMDEDSEYVQLVAHHRRKFKVPWEASGGMPASWQLPVVLEEMHSFLEQLCRSCLSVLTAQQGLRWDGP